MSARKEAVMFRMFECTLEKLNLGFHTQEGSTNLLGEIESPRYKDRYPALFQEEQGFHMLVRCALPPISIKVRGYDKLIKYVQSKRENVRIEFHKKSGQFLVSALLAPQSYEEDLEEFQFSCDLIFPLLILVGRSDKWNQRTIDLMLEEPHLMHQA
jgi:hypothetical protein